MGRWNANIPVRLASALARVTRALELLDHARTKPLQADLDSTALAIGALGRLLAVLAARALARRADDAARNAKLGRLAVVQVLERDDRRVDNVLRLPRAAAASASAAKPSATKPSAKELLENGAGTAHAAAHAARTVLEALLAILVVHLALVLVAQHLKGVLHLLELGSSSLVAGVAVRVQLHGHLAVALRGGRQCTAVSKRHDVFSLSALPAPPAPPTGGRPRTRRPEPPRSHTGAREPACSAHRRIGSSRRSDAPRDHARKTQNRAAGHGEGTRAHANRTFFSSPSDASGETPKRS